MKYLVWKDNKVYDDENNSDENRHCDCSCCEICSKYYKNKSLNVLCTASSYAELFDGNTAPTNPIHKTIDIDHTKYMITQISYIGNGMIEVSAKKVDWKKEMEDLEV